MINNDWLKELKVGDKVVVNNRYRKILTTVIKITPKGFIKTENGFQFNSDGTQRSSNIWDSATLLQFTDEVMLEFKKNKLVNQCKEIKFSELTIEQLEQILLIVNKEK